MYFLMKKNLPIYVKAAIIIILAIILRLTVHS